MSDFKPKFIAWYEDDFRADRIVQRWTCVQRALYRNLLIESYYNAERPFLPNSDEQLWLLADAENIEQWKENRDTILTKFEAFKDKQGRPLLKNKRVIEEWDKMVGQLEQRKNAGAASARKRADKKSKQSGRLAVVGAPDAKRKKEPKKEENNTLHDPTLPNPTLPKSVQRSSNARSTGVQVEEKAVGGTDGRLEGSGISSTSKTPRFTSGQPKTASNALSGWRSEFQKQIQEKAADKGITLQVPLPEHVFEFVESYGDLELGRFAVLDWFEGRSFKGLDNPNEAWNKMRNEIHGHLVACGLEDEANQ
jgi:uncharacterized protein YdaU (DUF1376 family)